MFNIRSGEVKDSPKWIGLVGADTLMNKTLKKVEEISNFTINGFNNLSGTWTTTDPNNLIIQINKIFSNYKSM